MLGRSQALIEKGSLSRLPGAVHNYVLMMEKSCRGLRSAGHQGKGSLTSFSIRGPGAGQPGRPGTSGASPGTGGRGRGGRRGSLRGRAGVSGPGARGTGGNEPRRTRGWAPAMGGGRAGPSRAPHSPRAPPASGVGQTRRSRGARPPAAPPLLRKLSRPSPPSPGGGRSPARPGPSPLASAPRPRRSLGPRLPLTWARATPAAARGPSPSLRRAEKDQPGGGDSSGAR